MILIDLDPLLLNYSEPFPLVILAGGAGTRLNKINKDIPKIMTPIGNSIFLDYFMDNVKKLGFNELYFLIFPDEKKLIENHLMKFHNKEKVKISFLYDGEERLGTGGSIYKNINNLPKIFWTMYGDTLLNFDILNTQNTFQKSRKEALLTVIRKEVVAESPNIKILNNEIISYSKNNSVENNFVDYGAMIFKNSVFKNPKSKNFDLGLVIQKLINEKNVEHIEMSHRFYEMGNLSSFKTLDQILIKNNIKSLWDE